MPTFPSPPDVISPEPWHLTDGGSLNLYFDVPGTPQWTRPEEARLAQSPCGGPPTLLSTNTSAQPRRFRVQVHIHWGANMHTRRSALEAAWAGKGPYTLTAPTIDPSAMTVILDASQGPLEWSPDNGRYTATVAFQEVA
jgi:hypothetical protein